MSSIALFKTHEITLEESGAGTRAKGKVTFAAQTKEKVECNVQPVTGRELEALPKGDRIKRHVRVTSRKQFKDNQEFSFDGDRFQFQTVDRWYNHSEGLAVKVDNGV